jgi:hypothetical protein
MKRIDKKPDGKYHVKGKSFELLTGSRAQVWHGTAYKTSGGLTKNDLMMNKHGRIVSKAKSATAKKEKRLEKAGYFTKKGTFGAIKKTLKSRKKSKKSKKSKK